MRAEGKFKTRHVSERRVIRMSVAAVAVLTVLLMVGNAAGSTSTRATGARAAGKKTVNVGFFGPLSGAYVGAGDQLLAGARLAGDIIDAHHGIMGRKVKVVPGDDGGDAVDAVPLLRKMLAVDHLSAMMGGITFDAGTALPILNHAKMVDFMHVGDPSLDHKLLRYVFGTAPSDSLTGAAMAYWAHVKHYKKIALVFDTGQGSQTLLPALKHAAKLLGMKIVVNATLPLGTVSYEAQAQQVVSAHPQAILTQVETPQAAGSFFTQLQRDGGGSIPLVGSDAMSDPTIVSAIGSGEAAQLVSITAAVGAGATFNYYKRAYEKYIGGALSYLAAYFYDGTNVAALAMIAAHSTKPSVYVKFIRKVTAPGKGVIVVHNFARGAALLRKGKRIKYFGVGTPMTFNKYNRVTGSYDVVRPTTSGSTTIAVISGQKLQPLIG